MFLPRIIQSQDYESVKKLVSQTIAKNTKRGYASDWRQFETYCLERAIEPLEAQNELVAMYLAYLHQKGFPENTIARRMWAINFAFKTAGREPPSKDPLVENTMRGIRRDPTTVKVTHKNPLLPDHLAKIMANVSHLTNRGQRDRALLVLGFAGAFRRSELLNLKVEDLVFLEQGLIVKLYRSKTNQEGLQETIAIVPGTTLCAIRELRSWLLKSGISRGPVFRAISAADKVLDRPLSETAMYYLFKKYVHRIGLDIRDYSPHCLRVGFATAADMAGARDSDIMRQGRWKDARSLRPYRANSDPWVNNAGKGLL